MIQNSSSLFSDPLQTTINKNQQDKIINSTEQNGTKLGIISRGRKKGSKNSIARTKNLKLGNDRFICSNPGCGMSFKYSSGLSRHKSECLHTSLKPANDNEIEPPQKIQIGKRKFKDHFEYQDIVQKLSEQQEIIKQFDWTPSEYVTVKAADDRRKKLIYSKLNEKLKTSKDEVDHLEENLYKMLYGTEVTEENKTIKDLIDYIFTLKNYILDLIEDKIDDRWKTKESDEMKKIASDKFDHYQLNISDEVKTGIKRLQYIMDDGIFTAKGIIDKFRDEVKLRWKQFEIDCNMQTCSAERLDKIEGFVYDCNLRLRRTEKLIQDSQKLSASKDNLISITQDKDNYMNPKINNFAKTGKEAEKNCKAQDKKIELVQALSGSQIIINL